MANFKIIRNLKMHQQIRDSVRPKLSFLSIMSYDNAPVTIFVDVLLPIPTVSIFLNATPEALL